jgi:lysophospholipase
MIAAADGWPLRIMRWRPRDAGPPLLLLNGRGDFAEKYAELAQDLAAAGYEVIAPDWRGQGLSGSLTTPVRCTHIDDYAQWVDDARVVIAALNFSGPLFMVAHSMGAHLGLRLLHDQPKSFRAAVLLSPMFGIRTAPVAPLLARVMADTAVRLGRGRMPLIGQALPGAEPPAIRMNRLTSDEQRFNQEKAATDANPALAIGGITYGWLAATFRSLDLIRKPGYAGSIGVPTLMMLAGREILVDNDAARRIAAAMPRCDVQEYRESRHEMLREADDIRTPALETLLAFLNQHRRD